MTKARRIFSPGLHTAALALYAAPSLGFTGYSDYDVPPRVYRAPNRKPKTPEQEKRNRKRAIAKASRKANRKA